MFLKILANCNAENILYTTCFAEHDAAEYWSLLSFAEQQAVQKKINQPLRDQTILSYGLRRRQLATLLDTDPRQLIFDVTANKKPILVGADLHFNVSHTEHHWALLINQHHAVGVDIESLHRSVDFLALAKRFFSATEIQWLERTSDKQQSFFRLWTGKEALLKASGVGLDGLDQCVLSVDAQGRLHTKVKDFQAWQLETLTVYDEVILTAVIPRGQRLAHCPF